MGTVKSWSKTTAWFVAAVIAAYVTGYALIERLYVCGAVFVPCIVVVGQRG
jgi:hypothetical protein